VLAHHIFSAVTEALEPGTCEQLVIYFSGHGYLNDGSEHWLLSDAPANPNEAISVEENIQLARDCGVPNVIFVSDACRSTPQSIKADRVRGTLIFPNTGVSATARADVDRFFACLPGDPAYEVAVDKSSGVYSALFTHSLQDASTGFRRRYFKSPTQSLNRSRRCISVASDVAVESAPF
jgi:hypothetical protein